MNNPLVSVKMITYNHEPYIAQAIEGVLQQETDFPIELVIGEDCSNDHTREIVMEYQKRHPDIIRVITSDQNVGMRKNSNRTAKACRGKYLAFCEGDDYWHHSKKLQMQVDYLEAHPEVGLIYADVVYNYVEKGIIIPSYYANSTFTCDEDDIMETLCEYVHTCTAVVRKDLYDEMRKTCKYEFSEHFMMGDIQTWIEMAYRSKVKRMDEVLATQNILPESASKTKDMSKKTKFMKNKLELMLHYADKYDSEFSMRRKKRIVKQYNNDFMHIAYRTCNPDLAREVIARAREYQVSLDPMDILQFIGSQNIVTFYLVWILLFPVRVARRILRVMCAVMTKKNTVCSRL